MCSTRPPAARSRPRRGGRSWKTLRLERGAERDRDMRRAWLALMAALIVLAAAPSLAWAAPATWETLPASAPLPPFDLEGRVTHAGARIWFAAIGQGAPVILLHGGDASSDFWGDQIPALLASGRRVILIDSRGHGRSTRDARPLGYELMES